jgi:DNA-binding beta-propeller fold protein YncE
MSKRVLSLVLALIASLAAPALCAPAWAGPMLRRASLSATGTGPVWPAYPQTGLGPATGDQAPSVSATGADRPPAAFAAPFGFRSALVGATPVGDGPSLLALNSATHTIYVANGANDNGPSAGGDTVSVIDARQCNAHNLSRCPGPWPTIAVGNRTPGDLPSGIAIDQATDTVYVANVGANTVSVFNGATCNALDHAGCGQTPANVPVGLGPVDLFDDPATHTVYVANFDAPPLGNNNSTAVSLIDTKTCNATDLSACPTTAPPTVDVGNPPDQVAVDQSNHTVYVTTLAGWSVFDADTCNATSQVGCGSIGYLAGDSAGPNDGQVDAANETLYTANYDNTISAFNLRDCDAANLAGCATDAPGTVTIPNVSSDQSDLYVAVDAPLDSVYVSYQNQDLLAVVDTRTCNGGDLAGCAAEVAPSIHTGASPEGVILDPATQTLYAVNEADNNVSVINPARCDAFTTQGCTHPAPSIPVPSGPENLAIDAAVHTAYITAGGLTAGSGTVELVDTTRCNAHRLAGCTHPLPQFSAGQYPGAVAVDPATHTVYIANYGAGSTGTVSVIDDRTCNATDQHGCTNQQTLQVPGGHAEEIAIDPVTDTLYVGTDTASGPNLISVFNAGTCNATDASDCTQTPSVMRVGDSGGHGLDLTVDDLTNTLYVSNNPYADPAGNAIYVFDGATCDALYRAGCRQTPATITVGTDPAGLAVDPRTNTVYAVVQAEGDYAAHVAVIDGATCDGATTAGCDQTPAVAPAGFGALELAIDPLTDQVLTANFQDASVYEFDGSTCNASNTTGCTRPPREEAVSNYPFAVAIDATSGTAYVTDINDVSVLSIGRDCASPRAVTGH